MTNNTDEFDQEQFETVDAQSEEEGNFAPRQSTWDNLRNKPVVKLLVIMTIVGVALAGALGAFSEEKKTDFSKVATVPRLNQPPGGAATQFFIEQNDQANAERAEKALTVGGSAIPTPAGHDITELLDKKKDPMVEFRAETERLKKEFEAEQRRNTQRVQMLEQKVQQKKGGSQPDDSLAKAMQKQMQEMMEYWSPKGMKAVAGIVPKEETNIQKCEGCEPKLEQASFNKNMAPPKVIVPAGTVNYMQLLTEANSDVPGPILAQVLSGPLAGGRAIGTFQVMNEYLVMTFKSVSYKGKDYSIDGLALDPDTTLGGMATEVDHRYFVRVLLPAAASFVSAFGNTLSDTDTTTTVTDNAVLVDQTQKGYKEAIYAGMGSVGQTMSQFFKDEANRTKTLVRVAVGTPMGLFFTSPVYENGTRYKGYEELAGEQQQAIPSAMMQQSYAPRGSVAMPMAQQGPYTTTYPSGASQPYANPYGGTPSGYGLTQSQRNLINSLTSGQ
jgi:intracellular multiplication protein IcmE